MTHLCIVTNKMDLDLADALEKKLIPTAMRPYVLYNILCGIKVGITIASKAVHSNSASITVSPLCGHNTSGTLYADTVRVGLPYCVESFAQSPDRTIKQSRGLLTESWPPGA